MGLKRRVRSRSIEMAPSAATVLVRSLMANRGRFEQHLTADDCLLLPPTLPQMGALDWRRHSEVMQAAYDYTRAEIVLRGANAPWTSGKN